MLQKKTETKGFLWEKYDVLQEIILYFLDHSDDTEVANTVNESVLFM